MKPLAMRPARLLALALSLHCAGTAAADTYPAKPVTADRAAGARRRQRHHRAHLSPEDEHAAGPALHRRQPRRRRRQHRHRAAAKAPPDGYTLLLTSAARRRSTGAVCERRLRPDEGFPAGRADRHAADLLVVNPALPANSLNGADRAGEGASRASSVRLGRQRHAQPPAGRDAQDAAGIDMLHVPYKGAAAAVTDVVGGQVPVSFSECAPAMPFVKSGKLKVLGVANEKRMGAAATFPPLARVCPASEPRRGTACSRRPRRRPRWWPRCTRPAPRRWPAPTCRRNWPSRAPSRSAWARHPLPRRSRMTWRAGPRWSGKPARRSTERPRRIFGSWAPSIPKGCECQQTTGGSAASSTRSIRGRSRTATATASAT